MAFFLERTAIVAIICGPFLFACSDGVSYNSPASQSLDETVKLEAFCSLKEFQAPKRQTFLLLDESAIAGVATASEFNAKNAGIREAVLAFADPASATESGRMAARERVTIFVTSGDSSPPRKVFTGCLPSYTQEENASLREGEGAVGRFVTGGVEQQIKEAQKPFTGRVAGLLVNMALRRNASEGVQSSDTFLKGLSALGPVFRDAYSVPRVILITDSLASAIESNPKLVRKEGFSSGRKLGVDFGNAEIFVLGKGGESRIARAYTKALFLPAGGILSGWAPTVNGLAYGEPPVEIRRYTGTVKYPNGEEFVTRIRIAADRSGGLSNSWFIVRDVTDIPIPMTGNMVCREKNRCELRSDRGGFAQHWVASNGNEPAFEATAPFGGLREWTFAMVDNELTGDIYDSRVKVARCDAKPCFPVFGKLQDSANF